MGPLSSSAFPGRLSSLARSHIAPFQSDVIKTNNPKSIPCMWRETVEDTAYFILLSKSVMAGFNAYSIDSVKFYSFSANRKSMS
jgi:hypothetical protein